MKIGSVHTVYVRHTLWWPLRRKVYLFIIQQTEKGQTKHLLSPTGNYFYFIYDLTTFVQYCARLRARPPPRGGPPLPRMPTTDLHRMPNDLDPVKLYRKTILVFIIVTDAHHRDCDSWPWPRRDLDPKPKPSDDPNPVNNSNRSWPGVIKCKGQRSNSWPWPCHDLDPVVTLTLNQNWVMTLTQSTTTTGHDPGSSSTKVKGQIIWHRCHITIYCYLFILSCMTMQYIVQ